MSQALDICEQQHKPRNRRFGQGLELQQCAHSGHDRSEADPPPLSKMNGPRFFAFQSVPKNAEFSLIETQLSCGFDRSLNERIRC
jgi:hypothetical protein